MEVCYSMLLCMQLVTVKRKCPFRGTDQPSEHVCMQVSLLETSDFLIFFFPPMFKSKVLEGKEPEDLHESNYFVSLHYNNVNQ